MQISFQQDDRIHDHRFINLQ